MSLRLRITLFIAVIVAVAVAVVAWISYSSTANEARGDIDRFLEDRAIGANRFSGRLDDSFDPDQLPSGNNEHGPLGEFARFDTVVQLVSVDGTTTPLVGEIPLPVNPEAIAIATGGGMLLEDVEVEGIQYRMITSPGPEGYVVQTGRDVTETDSLLVSLRLRLLLAGAAGVLMAAVGAWFVARQALSPVGRLTDAAEHVAETGDLDASIPAGGSDEVGRLATAFNGMLSALATSRRQQRQLVDDAGHELRTPLTSLRTNLEVLARNTDMDSSQRGEVMADVSFEIEQLSNLVSEVVELAGDAGASDQPLVLSDLDEIVREVADRTARRTGRTVEVHGTAGTALVRPQRISRAIANLLDNAAKWSPQEAAVAVHLDIGRIEVLDRGPGIPEEDLHRVFDRFYRSDSARTMPGSGLGLAIVGQIASEHGGSVFAEARKDGGAVVGFEVPIVEESP